MSLLTLNAKLDRTDEKTPWGFRMHGGKDFGCPITIQRVTPGSLAANCGLQVGDAIMKIGGTPTDGLLHKDAQQTILRNGNGLELTLQRGSTGSFVNRADPAPPSHVPAQQTSAFSPVPQPSYQNVAPKPYGGGVDNLSSQTHAMNLGSGPASGTVSAGGVTTHVKSPATNNKHASVLSQSPVPPWQQSSSSPAVTTISNSSPVSSAGVVATPPTKPPPTQSARYEDPADSSESPRYRGYQNPNVQSRTFKFLQEQVESGKEVKPGLALGKKPELPQKPSALSTTNEDDSPQYTKAIMNKQYNTPMGLYSDNKAASTFSTQSSNIIAAMQRWRSASMAEVEWRGPLSNPFNAAPVRTNSSKISSYFKEEEKMVAENRKKIVVPSATYQMVKNQEKNGEDSMVQRSVLPAENNVILEDAMQEHPPPLPAVGPPPLPSSGPPPLPSSGPPPPLGYTPVINSNPPSSAYTPVVSTSSGYTPGGTASTYTPGAPSAGYTTGVNKGPSSLGYTPGAPATASTYKPVSCSVPPASGYHPGAPTSSANHVITSSVRPPVETTSVRPPAEIEVKMYKPPEKLCFPQKKTAESAPPPSLSSALSTHQAVSTAPSAPQVVHQSVKTFKLGNVDQSSAPKYQSTTPAAPAPSPAPPAGGRPGTWQPAVPTGPRTPKFGKMGDARSMPAPSTAGRLAVCNNCGNTIRGPFISALDKTWCPDHFMCANPQCGAHLLDCGFVEEEGKLFCERDYEQYFAPRCNKCGRAIVGERVEALDKCYHSHCFVCAHCRQPIAGGTFHTESGQVYCQTDWASLFQTKCYGCQFPIEPGDKWVEALNQNWHSECFNCSTCQVSLEGQSFFAKGGKPYCKRHAGQGRF